MHGSGSSLSLSSGGQDAVVVEQDDVAVAINMDHIGHNCSPGEPTSDPMEASVASV